MPNPSYDRPLGPCISDIVLEHNHRGAGSLSAQVRILMDLKAQSGIAINLKRSRLRSILRLNRSAHILWESRSSGGRRLWFGAHLQTPSNERILGRQRGADRDLADGVHSYAIVGSSNVNRIRLRRFKPAPDTVLTYRHLSNSKVEDSSPRSPKIQRDMLLGSPAKTHSKSSEPKSSTTASSRTLSLPRQQDHLP